MNPGSNNFWTFEQELKSLNIWTKNIQNSASIEWNNEKRADFSQTNTILSVLILETITPDV